MYVMYVMYVVYATYATYREDQSGSRREGEFGSSRAQSLEACGLWLVACGDSVRVFMTCDNLPRCLACQDMQFDVFDLFDLFDVFALFLIFFDLLFAFCFWFFVR